MLFIECRLLSKQEAPVLEVPCPVEVGGLKIKRNVISWCAEAGVRIRFSDFASAMPIDESRALKLRTGRPRSMTEMEIFQ